jgi:hypothetical protein
MLSEGLLEELMKAIDENGDGVCDEDEWRNIIEPQVKAQSDFYKIMGGVRIHDPLVLEERILDLKYRNRHLEQELKVLRTSSGGDSKKALKQMAQKLLQKEKEEFEKTEEINNLKDKLGKAKIDSEK